MCAPYHVLADVAMLRVFEVVTYVKGEVVFGIKLRHYVYRFSMYYVCVLTSMYTDFKIIPTYDIVIKGQVHSNNNLVAIDVEKQRDKAKKN